MTQTVMITGADAGLGRLAVLRFGQRGAFVALVTRGSAGLYMAARLGFHQVAEASYLGSAYASAAAAVLGRGVAGLARRR
jgi:NAD(P)-dependent dehydrogenase (short-subunit alcohol dehydrogenase family)